MHVAPFKRGKRRFSLLYKSFILLIARRSARIVVSRYESQLFVIGKIRALFTLAGSLIHKLAAPILRQDSRPRTAQTLHAIYTILYIIVVIKRNSAIGKFKLNGNPSRIHSLDFRSMIVFI